MGAQIFLKILLWTSIYFKEILCNNITGFEIAAGATNVTKATIRFELNWNYNKYACTFTGKAPNSTYVCNLTTPWNFNLITPDEHPPFFMKINYTSFLPFAFIFQSINISIFSDSSGLDRVFYGVKDFCIPTGMQRAMNRIKFINESNTYSNCNHWKSKVKYNALAIGGNTTFVVLYIYFRNSIEHYTNSNVEGSVSPPKLTTIGFRTGEPGTGTSTAPFIVNSIQWDQTFYQCNNLSGTNQETAYLCNPNSLMCPSVQSNFWFSIYAANPVAIQCTISEIIVTDETGRTFRIRDFCVDESIYFPIIGTPRRNCSKLSQQPNGRITDAIHLSNSIILPGYWRAVFGYFSPKTLCSHTDHPFEVSNQSAVFQIITSVISSPLPGGFGTSVPLVCPQTNAPSPSPTEATLGPTQLPSSVPVFPPTLSPVAKCHQEDINSYNSGRSCINITHKHLWAGEVWYTFDKYVISLSGNLLWIHPSMMGSEENGLIGTIQNPEAKPKVTETFSVTNDRGLSVSVEVTTTGKVSVKSWTLPLVFYSNVGSAAQWYYIEQLEVHGSNNDTLTFSEFFKIHSGTNPRTIQDTHLWNLVDLMRLTLDGVTYISQAAISPTISPTISTSTTTQIPSGPTGETTIWIAAWIALGASAVSLLATVYTLWTLRTLRRNSKTDVTKQKTESDIQMT